MLPVKRMPLYWKKPPRANGKAHRIKHVPVVFRVPSAQTLERRGGGAVHFHSLEKDAPRILAVAASQILERRGRGAVHLPPPIIDVPCVLRIRAASARPGKPGILRNEGTCVVRCDDARRPGAESSARKDNGKDNDSHSSTDLMAHRAKIARSDDKRRPTRNFPAKNTEPAASPTVQRPDEPHRSR